MRSTFSTMTVPVPRKAQLYTALVALAAGCNGGLVEIGSGFAIDPRVRPALAEDGTVVAAEAERLLVGNGGPLTTIDLAPHGLQFEERSTTRAAVQIRSAGDIVFVANRATVAGCASAGRGAYRTNLAGAPPSVLLETCPPPTEEFGYVGAEIAMSPNGTVAVSTIENGRGSLYRGPVAGPLSILRTGDGIFYNAGALDVNDAGRVSLHMEYTDGFAGGLMRGILEFDTPEQDRADIDTAVEKLGVGVFTPQAINTAGTVVFSTNSDFSLFIGGVHYPHVAGVYRATPTRFNTPKMLTLVAGLAGPYCRFGNVDLNAAGQVVFEAALDGELGCGDPSAFDGLFTGPDPVADAAIVRTLAALGDHRYFDSVVLGQINDAGQVAFLTTYSEPLVAPYKIWRRTVIARP